MAHHDEPAFDDRQIDRQDLGETHASTGGAAIAGAATGGLIGMAAGPVGAAVGAVGGALVGAVSERIMHSDDDHDHTGPDDGHDHDEHDTHLRSTPVATPAPHHPPQAGITAADRERTDL